MSCSISQDQVKAGIENGTYAWVDDGSGGIRLVDNHYRSAPVAVLPMALGGGSLFASNPVASNPFDPSTFGQFPNPPHPSTFANSAPSPLRGPTSLNFTQNPQPPKNSATLAKSLDPNQSTFNPPPPQPPQPSRNPFSFFGADGNPGASIQSPANWNNPSTPFTDAKITQLLVEAAKKRLSNRKDQLEELKLLNRQATERTTVIRIETEQSQKLENLMKKLYDERDRELEEKENELKGLYGL